MARQKASSWRSAAGSEHCCMPAAPSSRARMNPRLNQHWTSSCSTPAPLRTASCSCCGVRRLGRPIPASSTNCIDAASASFDMMGNDLPSVLGLGAWPTVCAAPPQPTGQRAGQKSSNELVRSMPTVGSPRACIRGESSSCWLIASPPCC